MAAKRVLLIEPEDLVLYGASTDEALKAMFRQAFDRARELLASTEAEWTDDDGEIHEQRWRLVYGKDTEDLTTKQRGFLHAAVFPQIADQVRVDGERFVAKLWKEYYRAMFLGWRWDHFKLPGQKRAVPRKVRISTEDLNIRQYSEHIDKVIAHATTEFNVVFNFDQQEREAARYRPKKRKAKTPAQEAVAA